MHRTNDPQLNKEYFLLPDEQDARMYEKAQRIVESLTQQHKNLASFQAEISKLKPSDDIEKVWYQNGNAWKKFLNTIYQMLPK